MNIPLLKKQFLHRFEYNRATPSEQPKESVIEHPDELQFVEESGFVSDDNFVSDPDENTEGDPFLYSLETLTPDDIAPAPPKKRKNASELISSTTRTVTLVLCIAVFTGSFLYIMRTLYYYHVAHEIYGDMKLELDLNAIFSISDSAVRTAVESPQSPSTADFVTSMSLTNEDYAKITQADQTNQRVALVKANLNSWKLQNKDVYGYIKIPGTNIDDIVVQADDDDYYLTHSWKGDYLPNGAIFADSRCYRDILKNFNTIMYGHHMTDGTMFNTLDNFFEEDFFKNNKYIEVYTFDGIFTYEIFAVYITDMHDKYIQTSFASGEQFKEFAYEMKSRSIFLREDMEFNENDRLLTLSTCTNRIQTERIAVQAKLIKVEK
jgi:sortase, SrtB family